MQTLEFFESGLFSSRKASSKSRHLQGCLDTNFYMRVRKICTADDADSRCEHIPRGMPKRLISSPSPNSLSIKKYDLPRIRNTKWRYYGRTQNMNFPAQIIVFFFFFAARDSHCFRLQLQRGCIVFRFFPLLFGENVGRVFMQTTIYANLWKKESLTPFESFGTLRELHKKTVRKSEICVGKKLANTAWSSWPDQLVVIRFKQQHACLHR